MTSSIALPIHMLATSPQKSCGCSSTMRGPGTTPKMLIAPTSSAISAFDGMPRVSIGMKLVCAPALFALSGAATPSTAPRPKRAGSRETFFSSA